MNRNNGVTHCREFTSWLGLAWLGYCGCFPDRRDPFSVHEMYEPVLPDGFGFLRAPDYNYLPGPDDI
jgi:hypothetical protein